MQALDARSAVASEIMTPYVIMLDIDATFEDAINILHDKKISAVFLHDKGNDHYYVLSHSDVISYLKVKGMFKSNLADKPVIELMKGPIKMLDEDTPIDTVIRFLTKNNYKRTLISKNGKPVGVISTKDVLIWNNTYFKQAKPQIFLFICNLSSNVIARYFFEHNIEDEVKHDLIDLLAGALSSISLITDEVIKKSGKISQLMGERRSVLFEPYKNITGILICDYNSIELRRKLQIATLKFYKFHENYLKVAQEYNKGISLTLDIKPVISIFS
ncbi:MAG: CBS domain-containing protein [Candidatus Lokiarchaeota archaeon]|nr:CBS domain-containing protein [Candidatus Lokiarchaeota archaeon]